MALKTRNTLTKWLIYIIYFLLLVALILGITLSIRLNQINENIIQLSENHDIERHYATEIKYRFALTDNYAHEYLQEYLQGNLLLYQQTYADFLLFLEEKQAAFAHLPCSDTYQSIQTAITEYGKALSNIEDSQRAGKSKEDLTFYRSQMLLHRTDLLDLFDLLVTQVESEINTETQIALGNITQTRWMLTILLIIMIVTGPLSGYINLRQINTNNQLQRKQDVTELEFKQKLKDQKVELNQANQETKQFAYIVSHDLRASLTNLKGFTRELSYSLDQLTNPVEKTLPILDEVERQKVTIAIKQDIPEAINYINSSVNRMESFINAVLKLSRLGRKQLVLTEIDPNPLVEEIVANLTYQLELREGVVYAQKLPRIIADQTSLEQIFANVLDNAIKYWYQNRPLVINIAAKEEKEETIFAIKDNGRGIAKEDLDAVFGLFRRLGSSSEAGEGMGMAYVQAIVRNMGGRIWLNSTVSVGTTVFFSIPKSIQENSENEAAVKGNDAV